MAGLSRFGEEMLRRLQWQQPHEFAPTCYDEEGRVIDINEELRGQEQSYWEAFVEPEVALEIERRLSDLEEYEKLECWQQRPRPKFEEME